MGIEWGARNFSVGQRWKITRNDGTTPAKTFTGHVIYKTKYFIVLRSKRGISESFMYLWMNVGVYKMEYLN